MIIRIPPINQVLVPGYHGLDEASQHLASVTISEALTTIVTTPQGWLDIHKYGDPMINNALDQIALEIDGIERDSIEGDESGDETFEAIVGALRPLVRDSETLDAILYDAFDIAYDASVLVRERLLKRAEAEGDQATMDALDRPFFSPAEWAERKGLPPPPDDDSSSGGEDGEREADRMEPAPAADRDELPDHLTHPAGLLGKIVDYIVDSAQRPNRIMATGASIAVLATVIGRRVAGPTKSGTHIYCAALAPSAAGKDHPQKRAADLLRAVNDRLVGPGEFTSQNALVRFMTGQQLSLCVIDEFGAYLGRICHSRASTWERNTTKSLREYWGSSFETVAPMAWATCATDPIKWPALSILGSSTHDEFFSALSSKEAVNGFLNRFLLLSTMSKVVVVDEPSASKNEIPQPIIDTLASLYSHCVGDTDDPITNKLIADQSLLDANRQIPIAWADASVRAEFRALEKLALDKAENATIGELYGRTAEMALRLATIHAVSRAGLRAKLAMEDFAWGRELAMWSADTMAREASMRLADNESQARAKHVLRVIYEAGGTIKHRDLNRKLAHRLKPSDLRDTILSLQNSGEIGERRTKNPKGGPAMVTYVMRRQ